MIKGTSLKCVLNCTPAQSNTPRSTARCPTSSRSPSRRSLCAACFGTESYSCCTLLNLGPCTVVSVEGVVGVEGDPHGPVCLPVRGVRRVGEVPEEEDEEHEEDEGDGDDESVVTFLQIH